MTTTTLGGGHPLPAYVRQLRRESQRVPTAGELLDEVQPWVPTAGELLADHREKSISYETLYRVDEPGRWERIGPAQNDNNRALRTAGDRRYVVVSDSSTPTGIALALADPFAPRLLAAPAPRLLAAAELAAPAVGYVLGIIVHTGFLEWDTGETVMEAARRLALDAAWRLLQDSTPRPYGGTVFEAVLDALNIAVHPASEYGHVYLERRYDIDAALADRDIDWGGELLDAGQAADRAGIARSAWSAHVSRSEAPNADESMPARWRVATVDAWRHTRRRRKVSGW